MSILHSKFLVHWTGKNFHSPEAEFEDELDDTIRNKYVDRLADILTNGFLLQKNEEETERIYGSEEGWIQAAISKICFTEIKLSQAEKHAKSYGRLGIGVNRKYVINRYGNPVFYVMNGDHSNVATCARKVRDYLESLPEVCDQLKSSSEKALLEFAVLMTYMKRMGEKDSDDLQYYDELEWRITHLIKLENEGFLINKDEQNFKYWIKLSKEDVKVIIFPDEPTKTLAFDNPNIKNQIGNQICVTIQDCKHF